MKMGKEGRRAINMSIPDDDSEDKGWGRVFQFKLSLICRASMQSQTYRKILRYDSIFGGRSGAILMHCQSNILTAIAIYSLQLIVVDVKMRIKCYTNKEVLPRSWAHGTCLALLQIQSHRIMKQRLLNTTPQLTERMHGGIPKLSVSSNEASLLFWLQRRAIVSAMH